VTIYNSYRTIYFGVVETMAMEEPLYMIMSFNPFRSTSHQHEAPPPTRPPQPQRLDTSDDSWHTNAPQQNNNNNQYNNNHNPHPPPSYKSSTALSWLQSWATSSSTTTTIQSPQQTSISSSSIIVTHSDGTKHQHSTSTPPISQLPPAESIMSRGTGNSNSSCSPKSEEYTKEELEEIDNVIKNTIPPLPLHNRITEDGDCSVDLHHDLPPYPQPRTAPRVHTIDSTPRVVNKPLLEDFPDKSKATKQNSRRKASSSPSKIIHPKEETTFPGFTLYQTAKQQYVQGQYSMALDTTTNCLSFQQLALKSGSHAATAAVQQATKEMDTSPKNTSIPNPNNNAEMMTPLDMRSHFATSVGSSVLNAVQSLKTADSPNRIRHKQYTHSMLSNTISNLISKYPLHPCVAQSLLLRAHVLAACSIDIDGDLLVQSIQHVEMAVAMLRGLNIMDEELARPLVYFAKLKTQLGQYSEADLAYTEAINILQTVRINVKRSHKHAYQTEGEDSEIVAKCEQYLQQINDETAHALYLQGKSYQCQQMYAHAFDCYEQALKLYNKSIVSYKRNSLKVKCIVRCMRSRSALEKRVSSYWDDANII